MKICVCIRPKRAYSLLELRCWISSCLDGPNTRATAATTVANVGLHTKQNGAATYEHAILFTSTCHHTYSSLNYIIYFI